jgi:hypothetical protein
MKGSFQQLLQPDNSFVIKPAKRFAFFTQVLRQSLRDQNYRLSKCWKDGLRRLKKNKISTPSGVEEK